MSIQHRLRIQFMRRLAQRSACSVIPPYRFLPPLHCSTSSAKYVSGGYDPRVQFQNLPLE